MRRQIEAQPYLLLHIIWMRQSIAVGSVMVDGRIEALIHHPTRKTYEALYYGRSVFNVGKKAVRAAD
jgi:hypothetical protein